MNIDTFYDNPEYKNWIITSCNAYEISESIFDLSIYEGHLYRYGVPSHLNGKRFYNVDVKINGNDIFLGVFSELNFEAIKEMIVEKNKPVVFCNWLITNSFLKLETIINVVAESENKKGRKEQQKLFREIIGCRCGCDE